MKRLVKAQNFIEYAALIMIVSAALIAMNLYIQRAVNARLEQVRSELNESLR